ncbi:Gfo/Idh/MocA family protein [Oenococcus sicerae]|uniref:Gfo/Idh/MocA family oxidoreductase n=1 Tax=Oenococcus sicerae TaxID=2203724 RepID=A0AAJ1VM95_9LACO|nr:Gfo/Idh/MocA family oxidoreductase [Oenococcus sicerae]MDN6900323.1 Gfo/Idh/MocA family oxidoreductase [Oenococcus sicerae]
MIKLGLVGTHWITAQFAEAATASGNYEIVAIYSRQKKNALAFAEQIHQTQAVLYDDFDVFLDSGIQTVYLASPNSFHFQHAKAAIEHGVDAIVEKPVVSNPSEFKIILDCLANHPEVRLFEAARNYHDANFQAIKEAITNLAGLQAANLFYTHYSSRFDEYLANPDNPPNVFTTKFSGGALYDLGIYPLYDVVGWFGYPKEADYQAQLLKSGVDGFGWIHLKYDNFSIGIFISKTFNSESQSEIFALKETIRIDSPSELNQVTAFDGQNSRIIVQGNGQNPLLDEVKDFASVLNDRYAKANSDKYEDWLATASQVTQLLFDLRKSAGIRFSADND